MLITTGAWHFAAPSGYPADIKMTVDAAHGHGSMLIAGLRLPPQVPPAL